MNIPKCLIFLALLIVCFGATQVSCKPHDQLRLACHRSPTHSPSGIPVSKFYYGGKCYVASCEDKLTWDDAKHECTRMPALKGFNSPTLAKITMLQDDMTLLVDTMSPCGRYYPIYWTGAYVPPDKVNNKNNEWRWVSDNSRLSKNDHIWNDQYKRPRFDKWRLCSFFGAHVVPAKNAGLYDDWCSWKYQFLCQYEEKAVWCTTIDVLDFVKIVTPLSSTWVVADTVLDVKCRNKEHHMVAKCGLDGKWKNLYQMLLSCK